MRKSWRCRRGFRLGVRGMKRTKVIGLALMGCYLALLTVATVVALNHYRGGLARVTLARPEPGTLEYVLRWEATAGQGEGVLELPLTLFLPPEALEPGREVRLLRGRDSGGGVSGGADSGGGIAGEADSGSGVSGEADSGSGIAGEAEAVAGVGVILECVREEGDGGSFYRVRISLPEGVSEGEVLTAEIDCSGIREYAQVVPGRAIHLNRYSQTCVYVVEPQERAWGDEYIVKEQQVLCFPTDLSAAEVAILTEQKVPVVDWTSEYIYEGMSVWLLPEEPGQE